MRDFIVHDQRDNVGVAVVDIKTGQTVKGEFLSGGAVAPITASQPIPLGHKIALRDFSAGDTVIKYGEDIGKVVAEIRTGEHVHVHNLKTKRW
ncbi:MAG TPA: UxaA family hydrolase [Terriglobia bacterium]|nr:UxaA family hydrolase [Terriglobia bacterium]